MTLKRNLSNYIHEKPLSHWYCPDLKWNNSWIMDISFCGKYSSGRGLCIVSENEKLVFWHAPGFPNVILWTVSVVSTPILQLMSYVWWKLKVDRHTRTKVIPLQLSRFCNINSSLNLDQKTETVKTNALSFGLSLNHSKTVVH